MKKTCLFIPGLLFSLYLGCQNLAFKKISSYPSISFKDHFSGKSTFYFGEDTLLLCNRFTLHLFTTAKEVKRFDLIEELGSADKNQIAENYPCVYSLANQRLIIRNKNNAFIYDYRPDRVKFIKRISLRENHTKHIYQRGDVLYFFAIYNYHKRDCSIPSGFTTYDLKTGKEEEHPLPFENLALSHLAPNEFIDFSKNGYIVCDPLRYTLREYDFNQTLRDSIVAPDSTFTRQKTQTFSNLFPYEKVSQNPSTYLEGMMAYLDTLDRVWSVNYMDENTVFVRLTRNTLRPKGMNVQLFYDHLWQKQNGKWKLVQVTEISSFQTKEVISQKELWPYFFPGSKYSCGNGSLYYTYWSAGNNSLPEVAEHFFGFDVKDRSQLHLQLLEFKLR